jgi:hypothetical protein
MLSSPCEFLASAFWDIAHRFRLFFHRAWSLAFFWPRAVKIRPMVVRSPLKAKTCFLVLAIRFGMGLRE